MSKKLQYLIGMVLFLALMPTHGISQTSDDTKADKVERAHRTHVVKKAWRGTKRNVNNGAHATGRATKKAWRGTKRGVNTAVQAPGKAIHKAKVKHEADEKREGETN
ncbi:MAG TPA: hypothetical protein VG537_06060 [Candidatus Kapabacteria bacterium]|jgi:hypothetical protein|nr:hypothetical protein [Candidatus Kapabacteria bacterium]